jgi:sorbitol-specific phosphotransferase system component IIC
MICSEFGNFDILPLFIVRYKKEVIIIILVYTIMILTIRLPQNQINHISVWWDLIAKFIYTMKNKKCYTFGTTLKFNRNPIERGEIDTSNTHVHDLFPWVFPTFEFWIHKMIYALCNIWSLQVKMSEQSQDPI